MMRILPVVSIIASGLGVSCAQHPDAGGATGSGGQRIRDMRQGPDRMLYVVTDSQNGELWRIAPRS